MILPPVILPSTFRRQLAAIRLLRPRASQPARSPFAWFACFPVKKGTGAERNRQRCQCEEDCSLAPRRQDAKARFAVLSPRIVQLEQDIPSVLSTAEARRTQRFAEGMSSLRLSRLCGFLGFVFWLRLRRAAPLRLCATRSVPLSLRIIPRCLPRSQTPFCQTNPTEEVVNSYLGSITMQVVDAIIVANVDPVVMRERFGSSSIDAPCRWRSWRPHLLTFCVPAGE
jgi:hypothetical protein